jgi:hypothetical protein
MKKLITTILLLFASVTYADHEENMGKYYFTQVPALCGAPVDIQKYVDHRDLQPHLLSLGREGMKKTGEPVYMVTIFINKNETEMMATIDVPNGSERCVLFHTFDLTKPE